MTHSDDYKRKVEKVLGQDYIIAELLDRFGIPERSIGTDLYTDLIRSIIGQQLSIKSAETIYGRFLDKVAGSPEPSSVLKLSFEELRKAGLSGQKANYIRNVSDFFMDKENNNLDWWKMSDEEIEEKLIRIKGVGKWTIQMLLMFTFDRPDIFPISDLGIRMGMKKLYGLKPEGKELEKELIGIAEKWSPYRSIASKLIWKGKDS